MKKYLLSVVADMADGMPESIFNMYYWARLKTESNEVSSYCVLGYAIQHNPIFKDMGVLLDPKIEELVYKNETGFDAVAELFDISENEAIHLFHPQSYGESTPAIVGSRIREFIHSKEKEEKREAGNEELVV